MTLPLKLPPVTPNALIQDLQRRVEILEAFVFHRMSPPLSMETYEGFKGSD